MRITIDTDDRHTIDGKEYVAYAAIEGAVLLPQHATSAGHHAPQRKRKRLMHHRTHPTVASASTTAPHTESRKLQDLVHERDREYEDLRTHGKKSIPNGPKKNAWTEQEISTIIAMRSVGEPYSKISEKIGRSEKAIGVKLVELRKKGLLPVKGKAL